MDTEGIEFPGEDEHWDSSVQSIIFYACIGKKRIKCSISQIALTDYFHTEDTKEKALELFNEHRIRVNRLAERLIQEDKFNEKGKVFIKYQDCEKYVL